MVTRRRLNVKLYVHCPLVYQAMQHSFIEIIKQNYNNLALTICCRLRLKCDGNAQKPDFVFRGKGRVHLNRRGRQFIRLLTAEVCESAVVMPDTPCSAVVKGTGYPLHWPVSPSLPPPPPLRQRVPSRFNWTLLKFVHIYITCGGAR